MKSNVYLSLGSNMGDREKNLNDAVNMISNIENLHLTALSSIYETEPVGYKEQNSFLNLVIKAETDIDPFILLKQLQIIEASLKRVRDIRWGPRTIDIDVLLYGDLCINAPELTIPHPRMFERAFVLVPLKEVLGKEVLEGHDIDGLIELCSDKEGIRLFTE